MRSISQFIRNTVLGGLFFLVPLFIIYSLANKLWKVMSGVGERLAKMVGFNGSFIGIKGAPLMSSLVIVMLLFACGLLYKVSVVGHFRKWIDRRLEKYVPGYDVYKVNIEKKLKKEETVNNRQVVLINTNDVEQPGILIDSLSDGRKLVFIANKPGSADGKIYLVNAANVKLLNINEIEMNKLLMQQGKGLAALILQ